MKGNVYGSTIEIANQELEKIIEDYKSMGYLVTRYVKRSNGSFVEFNNADFWQAVRAGDGQRANRCNVAYIDRGINQNIINCIIRPAITLKPFQAERYY